MIVKDLQKKIQNNVLQQYIHRENIYVYWTIIIFKEILKKTWSGRWFFIRVRWKTVTQRILKWLNFIICVIKHEALLITINKHFAFACLTFFNPLSSFDGFWYSHRLYCYKNKQLYWLRSFIQWLFILHNQPNGML